LISHDGCAGGILREQEGPVRLFNESLRTHRLKFDAQIPYILRETRE